MHRRSILWAVLGGVAGGAAGLGFGVLFSGHDVGTLGDWRNGAARFIGMLGALGAAAGYLGALRLTRGPHVTRGGFTISYRRLEPTADGYRELVPRTVGDLLAALRALGYRMRAIACDDFGEPRGAIDERAPLAGANVAIRAAGVRGWIRVQLSEPPAGHARGLGLIEVWTERGDSADELGLFALRALDGLIGGLTAARDSSALAEDPASLVTSALPDRPRLSS